MMEVSTHKILTEIQNYGLRYTAAMIRGEVNTEYRAKYEASREIMKRIVELLPKDERDMVRSRLERQLTAAVEAAFLNPKKVVGEE